MSRPQHLQLPIHLPLFHPQCLLQTRAIPPHEICPRLTIKQLPLYPLSLALLLLQCHYLHLNVLHKSLGQISGFVPGHPKIIDTVLRFDLYLSHPRSQYGRIIDIFGDLLESIAYVFAFGCPQSLYAVKIQPNELLIRFISPHCYHLIPNHQTFIHYCKF